MAKHKQPYLTGVNTKANSQGGYYNHDNNASTDKYTTVHFSQRDSYAYRLLSKVERALLLDLMLQTHNKHLNKKYGVNAFTFTRETQKGLGWLNSTQVSTYLQNLERLGFIGVVERHEYGKKPNIYILAEGWKRYEPTAEELRKLNTELKAWNKAH